MAFSDFDGSTGRFTIAPNGRGLQNTEARSHSEGTTVRVLEVHGSMITVEPVDQA